MLEAVLDTNVFISGLLKGRTRSIINAWIEGNFRLVISEELLNELIFTLTKPKLSCFIPESDVKILIILIKEQAKFVKRPIKLNICRDIKDNMVLSCALTAKSYLITGDKDLLTLSPSYKGIQIIPPHAFIKILRSKL